MSTDQSEGNIWFLDRKKKKKRKNLACNCLVITGARVSWVEGLWSEGLWSEGWWSEGWWSEGFVYRSRQNEKYKTLTPLNEKNLQGKPKHARMSKRRKKVYQWIVVIQCVCLLIRAQVELWRYLCLLFLSCQRLQPSITPFVKISSFHCLIEQASPMNRCSSTLVIWAYTGMHHWLVV